MNETRNIIAGLEIGKEQSQLCYYDRKEREPISVSVKAGSNQYLFPTLLSKRPGKETWHYGIEAEPNGVYPPMFTFLDAGMDDDFTSEYQLVDFGLRKAEIIV